jgi:acyl-CoA synthetase (AMP-forming)/AMP-acid ligase II
MAPYKIPTVLKVVDEIERNAMGKVNKKVIVQKYWPDKV